MIKNRRLDIEPKNLDTTVRQQSFPRFTEALVRERTNDSKNHAEWAGISLAECLVARHLTLEKLTPVKIEKMRKRYQVAPAFVKDMLRSAKETFASEKFWQFSHS